MCRLIIVTVARLVPLVEQELLTLQKHMNSTQFLLVVRVTPSSVFSVVFYLSLFVFLLYLFWPLYCLRLFLRFLIIPLSSWYLQKHFLLYCYDVNQWKYEKITICSQILLQLTLFWFVKSKLFLVGQNVHNIFITFWFSVENNSALVITLRSMGLFS